MDKSVIRDLGIACLIFWGFIGLMVIWYAHKINEFNLGQGPLGQDSLGQNPHENPHENHWQEETDFSLPESSQEKESALNVPEQSTNL